LVIHKDYTEMHGQQNIKKTGYKFEAGAFFKETSVKLVIYTDHF